MVRRKETESTYKASDGAESANPHIDGSTSGVAGPISDFRQSGIAVTPPGTAILNFRIARAMSIIESDYRAPHLNLGLIGQKLGLTKAHLCRVFKREVGVGLPEYVCRVRARAAEKLLRESLLSIKEISAAVGFTYVTQLDRAFKVALGCTPREYRKRISARNSDI